MIQIDAESSSIGRYFPVTIGLCCDVRELINKLNTLTREKKQVPNCQLWTKNFLKQKTNYYKKRDEEADIKSIPIKPSGLFKKLNSQYSLCLFSTSLFMVTLYFKN